MCQKRQQRHPDSLSPVLDQVVVTKEAIILIRLQSLVGFHSSLKLTQMLAKKRNRFAIMQICHVRFLDKIVVMR